MKTRNLQNEKRWQIFWDFLVIDAVVAVMSWIFYDVMDVSLNSYIAASSLFGLLTLLFMYILDEYKIHVSSLYEQTVIFFLSSIYSYIIVSFIDLLILHSYHLALIHLIYLIALPIGLIISNLLISKIYKNTKWFRKPKLLIIETDSSNFNRMKRIKYGVLNTYDSWYESLDVNRSDEFERLVSMLDDFDALCLLDKMSDEVYDNFVKIAIEKEMDLYVSPKLKDIGRNHATLSKFDDVVTFFYPDYKLGTFNDFLKRITDIVFSLVLLIIFSIPMLLIAFLVKVTSPGEVFYKQIRLTKDKKEFYIYKFRTMVKDAEKMSGPVFAQKDDPRVTPIGKILRSFRLDELPQLLNILKGDMSVVGPRPERPFFVSQYEKEMEEYRYRFAVKAGLTGLSHVYGRYSTYVYDRTCFDLMYITQYSYFLDLKIMLLTSKIIFLKEAAEGEDEYKLSGKKVVKK